jgi:molecular chaperone DnaJ
VKCGDCIGSGYLPGYFEKALSVKIPPGIDNGMQVRLTGEGEESVREMGRSGDVMAFVLVKDHPIFNREGANITVEIPVSFTQLVLGDEIEIPTLEGSLKVKVPPGSQSHTKFRLKGKGFPTGQGTVGDLLATLKVETPKSLDEEYKKVIEQLAEVEKTTITARREQWAKKVEENSK